MADDPGASEGERANARSILERMGPEPTIRVSYKTHWQKIVEEMNRAEYSPPSGVGARPAGRRSNAYYAAWKSAYMGDFEDVVRRPGVWDEFQRQARTYRNRENLRRMGFRLPDDPGFESEYTSEAMKAQQTFRRASERILQDDPGPASDIDRMVRDYQDGRISVNDLRRALGLEDY